MNAYQWIERVKAAKGWESDYRVAKELDITRGAVSIYKNKAGTLDEEIAVKVAETLAIDPIIILADQAMERSKSEKAKSAWAGILGRFSVGQQKTPTPSGAGVQDVAGGNGGARKLRRQSP